MKMIKKWHHLIISTLIFFMTSSVFSTVIEKVYTFDRVNSFLQIDSTQIWPITVARELAFSFRTDRPNALLLFHTIDSAPLGYPIYEFYLTLEQGNLKVIHEFGQAKDTFTIGKGLHQDQWHSIKMTINPSTVSIRLTLNNEPPYDLVLSAFKSNYSKTYYPYEHSYYSLMFFGGVNPDRTYSHRLYDPPRFVGCIGNITFGQLNLSSIEKVKIENAGLSKSCLDKCFSMNDCSNDVKCINHYTHVTCDCSGTIYEDSRCSSTKVTTLVFKGYSRVWFKAFDWNERAFSSINRVSLFFKTIYENSLLFSCYGLYPILNYFLIYIEAGHLVLEIDFGYGPIINSIENSNMTNDNWHNVTFVQNERQVHLFLDDQVSSLKLTTLNYHFHLEPYLYIADVGDNLKRLGQRRFLKNKFVGCMKGVYFNGVNIFEELKNKRPNVIYDGLFNPEFECTSVTNLPITFKTPQSYIKLISVKNKLRLYFEFKTIKPEAVLTSGYVRLTNGHLALWILYFNDDVISFSIIESESVIAEESQVWSTGHPVKIKKNVWQTIKITSYASSVVIKMNNNVTINYNYSFNLNFEKNLTLGGLMSTLVNSIKVKSSLIGCMSNIQLDQSHIDAREILNTKSNYNGKLSLDNCSLVNPCDNPGICENGGICHNIDGKAECDCENTGYAGKTCHFSIYKRSCEEYYLIGYRENGTYVIDIDRNGHFSPARVECTMSSHGIETSITNNLPLEYNIRKKDWSSYYMDINYRDFTKPMLQAFISQTKSCTQEIKYGCRKAPLRFSEDTWMISASDKRLEILSNHFGNNGICANSNRVCNCDNNDDIEDEDIGVIDESRYVGITRVYVRANENLTETSEGRLTISPIKCVDISVKDQIITFKNRESYLQVKGWENDDLSFSFRTIDPSGILIFQAPFYPHHGYFKISILNSNELMFEYLIDGNVTVTKLTSRMSLNTGQWQQVWVDFEGRHVRFTVNVDYVMIDIDLDSYFDKFEGPLYIGGAPKFLLKNDENGFVGCFKNLRIKDQLISLTVPKSSVDITSDCIQSCSSNPCEKEANCIEMWGTYECQCSNPYTQKGKNCEHDFNSNSITFKDMEASLYTILKENASTLILEKSILIGFRTYQPSGLIFYAKDRYNNFIQLHFEDHSKLYLTFNTLTKVVRGLVQISHISKGSLIQIKIDRSASNTILNVFTHCDVSCKQHYTVIDYPLHLLTYTYTLPWTLGERFELVKTNREFFSNVNYVQLFIGGVSDSNITSLIPPFIGCISGMVIDNQLFDLQELVNQKLRTTNNSHIINVGCHMNCDKKPCANDGECKEDLTTGEINCTCNSTSYKGEDCNQDTGVYFDGLSTIRYNINFNTTTLIASDWIKIKFAFSADPESFNNSSIIKKQKRIIMLISQGAKRIVIALVSKGSLWIEDYDGKGHGNELTPGYPSKLTDGYRHWIIYTRDGYRTTLEIDYLKYTMDVKFEHGPSLVNDKSKYFIKVGGDLDIQVDGFQNYIGCISNIDIELNNLQISPLEAALNGDDRAQVNINGSFIFANIKHTRCANFRPKISKFKINLPLEVTHDKWTPPPPIKIPITFPARNMNSFKAKFIRQMFPFLICTCILSCTLTGVSIYMYKLNQNYKLHKFRVETPFFNSRRASKIPYLKVGKKENSSESVDQVDAIDKGDTIKRIQFKRDGVLHFSQLQALEEASEENEDKEDKINVLISNESNVPYSSDDCDNLETASDIQVSSDKSGYHPNSSISNNSPQSSN